MLVHNRYTGGNIDVDKQNATYTVIFGGAQTFTYTNIKPVDVNFTSAYITSPSVPGNYTMRCIFNGTSLFSPVETDQNVTFKEVSSSATPTPVPANNTSASGTTPVVTPKTPLPGATATSISTVTATATATMTAASNSLHNNTISPSSSNQGAVLLWTLAVVVICSGAGGLGLLVWRKRKISPLIPDNAS